MNEHDATETAYKNGYARAKEDILKIIREWIDFYNRWAMKVDTAELTKEYLIKKDGLKDLQIKIEEI